MLKCVEIEHVRPWQDRLKYLHLVFNFDSSPKKSVSSRSSARVSRSRSEKSFSSYLLWQPQKTPQGRRTHQTAAASKSSLWKSPSSIRGKRKSKGSSCLKVWFGSFFSVSISGDSFWGVLFGTEKPLKKC